MQQEKKEYEGRIHALSEKVGVKIMDRKIQAQLNESQSLQQSTFLPNRRVSLFSKACIHHLIQCCGSSTR